MRKRLLLVSVLALAAVLSALALRPAFVPPPPLTKEKLREVRVGMSREEVRGMLGQPPGGVLYSSALGPPDRPPARLPGGMAL